MDERLLTTEDVDGLAEIVPTLELWAAKRWLQKLLADRKALLEPGWHEYVAITKRWLENYPEGTIVDHPFPRAVRAALALADAVMTDRPDSNGEAT